MIDSYFEKDYLKKLYPYLRYTCYNTRKTKSFININET